MGARAELAHNRSGLAGKLALTGAAIGLGILVSRLARAERR
ncbi:hypothetical protein ACU4GA_11140 [Methylobacterium oryzae CBMB20]